MTADVTAPPTPARRPRTQPSPHTTTLTVPAKPAAVTGANVAAIAGTAVAATGPIGVALATVAVGGAGGYAAYRAVSRRRARRQSTVEQTRTVRTTGSGGGLFGGLPRVGRAGAGTPGGRTAGSKPSPFPRGGAGGGRSGDAAGGKKRAAGGGKADPGSGHRKAGSPPGSSSRSPLTASKVAAARQKLANRRQPGPRLSDAVRNATKPGDNGRRPTARQAWRAARNNVTGNNPKKRGTIRRAVAGVAAGLIAADKAQRENWKARKRREAARARLNQRRAERLARTGQKGSEPARQTAAKVRRPTAGQATTTAQKAPVPTPGGSTSNGRNDAMNNQGQPTPQPTSQFWRHARELHANAVKFKPKGMIEVRTEAYEMPHSLAEIAQAIRARAQECTKQPLHPNLAAALMQIAATVEAAAQSSRTLGPAFDALHATEVTRILKPRANEAAWDTHNNR